ncbi:hypothetical protein ACA910_003714 [Epithemia clementina (nom. ined.)]
MDKEQPKQRVLWEAWNCCAMGLSPSPYQATQSAQRVKLLAFGDRRESTNVFQRDRVVLNLPRDPTYNPACQWVYKVRKDGELASNVHAYVDDMRETVSTEEEAWKAASRIAKAAAFNGLQDAARKRRPPSQTPGAWADALIITGPAGVYKLVSDERWKKTRNMWPTSKHGSAAQHYSGNR